MPWPPTTPVQVSTGFIIEGISTIVWGTDWATIGFGGGNYAIVKSIRPAERAEEIRIENGVGLTAIDVLLRDGYDYDVTVVDQFTVSYPVVGTFAAIITPFQSSAVNGIVVSNSYDAARKKEGDRIFTMRSFTLIPTFVAAPGF
jgi:hypothetical protein